MPEISIKDASSRAFIKVHPERSVIGWFKANFLALQDTIRTNPTESKEFLKAFKMGLRLIELGSCKEGEVHMTFCKSVFSNDPKKAILSKEAIIGPCLLRKKMSQREIVYIDEDILLSLKKRDGHS